MNADNDVCRCGHERISHGTADTHCTMCGPHSGGWTGAERCYAFEWDTDARAAANERYKAVTQPCSFRTYPGFSDRPVVDQLHSHSASLAYDLFSPNADDDVTPLDLVTAGDYILDLAQRVMQDTVDRARDAGCTWQEIGDKLHVTRQAAQMRFGRKK